MTTATISLIEQALDKHLDPTEITITDDSQHHIGHAGAKSGGGHFSLHIAAPAFEGKSLVQCHRLIYDALGDLMKTHIHALSIHIDR